MHLIFLRRQCPMECQRICVWTHEEKFNKAEERWVLTTGNRGSMITQLISPLLRRCRQGCIGNRLIADVWG